MELETPAGTAERSRGEEGEIKEEKMLRERQMSKVKTYRRIRIRLWRLKAAKLRTASL